MIYNKKYYRSFSNDSNLSANIILSEIFKTIECKSVIDIGCGTGMWLENVYKILKDNQLILTGVDGYQIKDLKKFNKAKYYFKNLEEDFIFPKHDFLMCMEVAEHLSSNNAKSFVNNLCGIADVILFSAAVPGQGGLKHINERYANYWIDLFKKNDFVANDSFKKNIWMNNAFKNCPYYISNSFLFINKNSIKSKLFKYEEHDISNINKVHPFMLEIRQKKMIPFREHLSEFFPSFIRALKNRFNSKIL